MYALTYNAIWLASYVHSYVFSYSIRSKAFKDCNCKSCSYIKINIYLGAYETIKNWVAYVYNLCYVWRKTNYSQNWGGPLALGSYSLLGRCNVVLFVLHNYIRAYNSPWAF